MITAVFNVNMVCSMYNVHYTMTQYTQKNVLHVLCDVDIDIKINENVFSQCRNFHLNVNANFSFKVIKFYYSTINFYNL